MTSSGKAVPLHFITGFLGSGKTTLLNRILDEASVQKMKIGVIINEWGKVSIDSGLVSGREIEIEELNDGQVFCSCLAGDFVKALSLFSQRPLDAVIVETSGMANPFPLKKILMDLQQMTGHHYDYRGMTALVDPENFLDLLGIIQAVEEQVIASQRIIINKIDLARPGILPQIREKILQLNASARIFETSHARIDGFFESDSIPMLSAGLDAMVTRQTTRAYQRPGQYVITTDGPLTSARVEAFIRELLPWALRIKGIIKDERLGWLYIDGVNMRVEAKPVQSTASQSKLVIIPKGGIHLEGKAITAWDTICGVSFTLG